MLIRRVLAAWNRPVGTNAGGQPTPTFREQTHVPLNSLCYGSYHWGNWKLVRPGLGEQGYRKSRGPGGSQWEALGPGAK